MRRAIEDALQTVALVPTITLLAARYDALGWIDDLILSSLQSSSPSS
jgi:hypothetical protein